MGFFRKYKTVSDEGMQLHEMNKAIKIISIGIDKIAHFALGYMIADLCEKTGFYAVLIALLAGVSKELFDKYVKHTVFDWFDLACTVGGGFVAYWFNLVIK